MGRNKIFNDDYNMAKPVETVETPVYESPIKKADQNVPEKIMTVTGATTVNVRMSPSPKAEVGKTVHEGDKVTALGKVGNYFQIKAPDLPGNVAYILSDYLK